MKNLSITLTFILFSVSVFATHLESVKSGEIIYAVEPTNSRKINISLILYREVAGSDFSTASLDFGDGSSIQNLQASSREPITEDIEKVTFSTSHVYSSIGKYVISFYGEYRNKGILNMGKVDLVPFYFETSVIIDPFLAANSSPVFLSGPIGQYNIGDEIRFNMGGYDADEDILRYDLINPKVSENESVPNYKFEGAKIHPITGEFVWAHIPSKGRYTFAVRVKEYRDGLVISHVIRDFLIDVVESSSPSDLSIENRNELDINDQNLVTVYTSNLLTIAIRLNKTGSSANLLGYSEVLVNIPEADFIVEDKGDHLLGTFSVDPQLITERDEPYILYFRGIIDSYSSDLTIALNTKEGYVLEELPTGFRQKESERSHIFPNPARGFFNIICNTPPPYLVQILDQNGQELINSKTERAAFEYNHEGIQKGVYVYSIFNSKGDLIMRGKLFQE